MFCGSADISFMMASSKMVVLPLPVAALITISFPMDKIWSLDVNRQLCLRISKEKRSTWFQNIVEYTRLKFIKSVKSCKYWLILRWNLIKRHHFFNENCIRADTFDILRYTTLHKHPNWCESALVLLVNQWNLMNLSHSANASDYLKYSYNLQAQQDKDEKEVFRFRGDWLSYIKYRVAQTSSYVFGKIDLAWSRIHSTAKPCKILTNP